MRWTAPPRRRRESSMECRMWGYRLWYLVGVLPDQFAYCRGGNDLLVFSGHAVGRESSCTRRLKLETSCFQRFRSGWAGFPSFPADLTASTTILPPICVVRE